MQHFDRIVRDHAQVGDASLAGREQQVTDAGPMYFNAEKVALRSADSALQQMLAVAEADLERAHRDAAEHAIQVERADGELDAITRPQGRQRALLRIGDATCAHDI